MAFWLSDVESRPFEADDPIYDGLGLTEYSPAIAEHTKEWSALAYRNASKVLVRCDEALGFSGDPRITAFRRIESELAALDTPLIGSTLEDAALAVTRRQLLRQRLGNADKLSGANFSLRMDELTAQQRQAIRDRLPGFDFSGIVGSTTIGQALNLLLPQIRARIFPKERAGQRGTFTDDFSGEASSVDLASHTPSGGGTWSRDLGSANDAQVTSGGILIKNTSTAGGYRPTDQLATDMYTEFKVLNVTTNASFVCHRISIGGSTSYMGVRCNGSLVQIYSLTGDTTFVKLAEGGSPAVNDIIRFESEGDDHSAFINGGAAVASANNSLNNTITRHGLIARGSGTIDWLDDYEAGELVAAGGASITTRMSLLGVGL